MRIGSDFPKIRWEINDWVFLEPNALIGDVLLFSVSMYIGYQIYKRKDRLFYRWWSRFFFCFGFLRVKSSGSVIRRLSMTTFL
jgi:hypothetical protein